MLMKSIFAFYFLFFCVYPPYELNIKKNNASMLAVAIETKKATTQMHAWIIFILCVCVTSLHNKIKQNDKKKKKNLKKK